MTPDDDDFGTGPLADALRSWRAALDDLAAMQARWRAEEQGDRRMPNTK